MSSVKRIICLSNSKKLGERCIAGIDIDTGKWIRPVYDNEDGSVPRTIRLVEGREPELLDILEIPLASNGNDFGFACENLSILPGQWKLLGKAGLQDLVRCCENTTYILHNRSKYVRPSYLKTLPFSQRNSLQLVHAVSMSVENKYSRWQGSLKTYSGQTLQGASITDPVFLAKLESGYQPTGALLVTVSLGMPYIPESIDNWDGEASCWKLIAGVIEISSVN
jgi:hypothetical protein